MVECIIVIPGSTSAGEEISIGADVKIEKIAAAKLVSLTEGTPNTFSVTSLTVVDDTPSGNQIQLYTNKSVKLGVDTDASDMLILFVVKEREYTGV